MAYGSICAKAMAPAPTWQSKRIAIAPCTQRKAHVAKALPDLMFLADAAAKSAPGSVDAPIGVIIGAAVLVSAGSLAVFTLGLKPGTDAAIDMQKRDAKSGRFRK